MVDELEGGVVCRGLWAKALAQNGFDEKQARAAYVQMRVQDLMANAPRISRLAGQLAEGTATMDRAEGNVDQAGTEIESLGRQLDEASKELAQIRQDVSRAKMDVPAIRRAVVVTYVGGFAVAAALLMWLINGICGWGDLHVHAAIATFVGGFVGWCVGMWREESKPEWVTRTERLTHLQATESEKVDCVIHLETALEAKTKEWMDAQSRLGELRVRCTAIEEELVKLVEAVS